MPLLYEQPDPSLLLPLLRSHLPTSLSVFSALLTPGNPLKVSATFAPTDIPDHGEHLGGKRRVPWVILIDASSQFRFFCDPTPCETIPSREEREDRDAESLLESVLREVVERASRENRDMVRIGAIPDQWTSVVERVTGVECESASRVWCDASFYAKGTCSPVVAIQEPLNPPPGYDFRAAREEDVPVILSTSGVPHLPSYLSSRLAHTSCLVSVPSAGASGDRAQVELVAHVTTHRDGSLGTLYVDPAHRRLGLARLVMLHRLCEMRRGGGHGNAGYCYVSRNNEGSRASMKSLGWRESERDVWWDIVDVKQWEARRESTTRN